MDSVHTSHLLLLTFKYVIVLLFSITSWVLANLQDVKGIQRTTKTEVLFIMMNLKVPVPDLHSLLVWNIHVELVLKEYIMIYVILAIHFTEIISLNETHTSRWLRNVLSSAHMCFTQEERPSQIQCNPAEIPTRL